MTPNPRRARLEDLLALEATQGLTPAQENELDTLLAEFPDEDPDGFELAAAAVHLALAGEPEELPPALAEKLHLTSVALTPTPRPVRTGRPAWMAWSGWVIAASLAGLLIYTNWPKSPRVPTLEEERAAFEGRAKPARFADAKPGTSGDVVWSAAEQKGYLEVRGLPANDPAKEQYQLWIVDGSRTDPDHKQPVSGGVFDVKPDGTAIVPITAAIQVKDAKAFAVTKETAGGVTVSKGPMLLVMTPKAG